MASYIDQFTAESLLVIKRPPTSAPTITSFATAGENNFMEDRFLCFAYRYQYQNGEYSATSQFTEPAFIAKSFTFGFNSFLNEGMTNNSNAVNIEFNTGSSLVIAVELLFKETGDSTIKIIENLNKAELGYGDDNTQTYLFDNQKIFTVLPEYEILRLYDNVPLLAKAQTLMGNRLIYGNYVEGYNLVDRFNNPLNYNFSSTLVTEEITETDVTATRSNGVYNINGNVNITNAILNIPLDPSTLIQGASISLTITVRHAEFTGQTPFPTETTVNTDVNFTYILQQTYTTVYDLATSSDFVAKIGTASNIQTIANSCNGVTFTDNFNCAMPSQLDAYNKCKSGISAVDQPIEIISTPSSNTISLQFPAMQYIDDCASPTQTFYEYYSIIFTDVVVLSDSQNYSLHSNRGYEIGIVYMDEYNRATTALVSPNNTVHVPCSNSVNKNEIHVTIPGGVGGDVFQAAPFWATRYKFVIKPDKSDYETIYSNIIYQDPISNAAYFLLEGENSKKIEAGDRLIVKRDASGPTTSCVFTTVLEKESQSKNFITIDDPLNPGTPIEISAGVYMKINPNNFSTTALDDAGGNIVAPGRENKEESNNGSFPKIFYPVNVINPSGSGATSFVDYTVPAGSLIKLFFFQDRQGNPRSVEKVRNLIDFTVVATKDYTDFKEAWDGEDIGSQLDLNQVGVVAPGPQPDGTPTITNSYNNTLVTQAGAPNPASQPDQAQHTFFYQFFKNSNTGQVQLGVSGPRSAGNSSARIARLTVNIEVVRADATCVFETLPTDALADVWYENDLSFSIDALGQHNGNIQDQQINFQNVGVAIPQDGIVNTGFSNCITFGNGVESYKIRDSLTGKSFTFGNRVTSTSSQIYKEAHRFADLTYSGIFNDESNVNKLNEFNLGLLNFKPLEDTFGPIEKLAGRRDDILTLQEDRISYVLQGKDLLTDAAGGGALTSVPLVLGKQVARSEEYGISNNPESFVLWGADMYFTDAKRGAVINLKGSAASNDRLFVVSEKGMRGWFRDFFITTIGRQKLGGFDPYMNEYILSSTGQDLPSEGQCSPCGVTENVRVNPNAETIYCVNLAQSVGQVTVEYIIPNAVEDDVITEADTPSGAGLQLIVTETGEQIVGEDTTTGVGYTITAVYNDVEFTSGLVFVSGSFTFNKNIVDVTDVTIIITTSSTIADTLEVRTSCPQQTILNLYNIALTSSSDSGQFIHNEYSWTDNNFTSPLHGRSNLVTFQSSKTNPVVSQYQKYSGPLGSGAIPDANANVTIISNKIDFDNFVFDSSTNRFLYLRSDTVFTNTSNDINALLGAAAVASPIVEAGDRNYANFTMPSSAGSNLYLIWDYRKPTGILLNYSNKDAYTSCCSDTIAPTIPCGQVQGGGYGYPSIFNVTLPSSVGTVTLHFDAGVEPDRFVLEAEGVIVIDTGYRGDASQQANLNNALTDLGQSAVAISGVGSGSASYVKPSAYTLVKISVYAPITTSIWSFTVDCPV